VELVAGRLQHSEDRLVGFDSRSLRDVRSIDVRTYCVERDTRLPLAAPPS
jgi:hypothetical protein